MLEFNISLKAFNPAVAPDLQISCSGRLNDSQILDISYQLSGDLSDIELEPLSDSTGRADDLWQKTCFELFVKTQNSPRYWEYNISPAGQWAAYGFSQYRDNRYNEESVSQIPVTSHVRDNLFILECSIPLPATLHNQSLETGISTVIRTKTDELYYYALKHCSDRPDFHDKNSFILTIGSD